MCSKQTPLTHTAEQLSAWGQHHPESLATDSSWCQSATLWLRTEWLCLRRGDWRQKVKSNRLEIFCSQTEEGYKIQKYVFCNKWDVCFGWRECFSTRVCSRASSASAQNSLTEPDQSESLQMSPEKQRARQWAKILLPDQIHWKLTDAFAKRSGQRQNNCLNDFTCSMTTCLPW